MISVILVVTLYNRLPKYREFRELDITYFIAYVYRNQPRLHVMKSLSATQARKDIYRVIDETCETNEPVLLTTKRSDAVLVKRRCI
jgi:hypothetical protein